MRQIGRSSIVKLWHCIGTNRADNIPEIMKLRCNKSNGFIDFNMPRLKQIHSWLGTLTAPYPSGYQATLRNSISQGRKLELISIAEHQLRACPMELDVFIFKRKLFENCRCNIILMILADLVLHIFNCIWNSCVRVLIYVTRLTIIRDNTRYIIIKITGDVFIIPARMVYPKRSGFRSCFHFLSWIWRN